MYLFTNNEAKMEIKEVLENKMPKAIEYASHIIMETSNFIDFAVALVDYMEEDFIPYCKSVYVMLRGLSYPKVVFEEDDKLEGITPDVIRGAYHNFLSKQGELVREKEFKENIDELQFLVKSYRDSNEFQKMLDFIGRFPYLAPYNAMLAQMQKPGATFVLTGKKWAEYGRQPKLNGQKLIVLKPFGPVQCVFDFEDTEPIPNATKVIEKADLIKKYTEGLQQAQGDLDNKTMNTLVSNLPVYGIYLDDNFMASNTYGGYIMPYHEHKLKVKIGKDYYMEVPSCFVISINKKQTNAVKFHTLCHELGHLFCNHQCYDKRKKRKLTLKEKEFEAETVAWLMCKRHGISNPSEEYLASYAPNGEIPICSTELIMRAVTEIEKMMEGFVSVNESIWYKEDAAFKASVNAHRQKLKRSRQSDLFGYRF